MEHRYRRTPDGLVWTATVFGYSFWMRYLDVFDGVKVVARVLDLGNERATPARYQSLLLAQKVPMPRQAEAIGCGLSARGFHLLLCLTTRGPWSTCLNGRG